MQKSSFRHLVSAVLVSLAVLVICSRTLAQSNMTGFVAGQVTDSSGAVVPNASVTLKDAATSATQTSATSAEGTYRFSFISPGSYIISVVASGFQPARQAVSVNVGQGALANIALVVTATSATVTVQADSELVQTQNADVTTSFTEQQVAQTPNPGNDLTAVAQTAPGVTMNTQGGGGNFSVYGMPATGNLFQLNGMDETGMYTNANFSGASNLTLGLNEVQTATVVSNAYSGEYGRLAGSQVDYVTKSGSNEWHGDSVYSWNGRVLNANDYFNNKFAVPRPFDNANQWAASLGGPVVKNHTFFFADFEGIRFVLPTSAAVNIPSPEFEQATLTNLATVSPESVPLYNQIFGVYNNAPGAAAAQNILSNGGCGSFTGLAPGVPCALQFQATPRNLTNEWLLSWRIDQIVGQSDRLFLRLQTDHGTQASTTSPLTPVFNTSSVQPEWQGEFSETHTFGANSVNNFTSSFRWVKGAFGPASIPAAVALMPFQLELVGGSFSSAGLPDAVPTGRSDLLYQVGDNYTYVLGKHILRFGIHIRRDLVSDRSLGANTLGTALASLNGFFNGQVDESFTQAFAKSTSEPFAYYNLSWFGEDDWRVNNKLNLTLALHFEHNSNPICVRNCFGRLEQPFESLDHDADVPYNEAINPNGRQAFFQSTNVSVGPRIGFAWTPFNNQKTVVRGGFGMFTQGLPGEILNNFAVNTPNVNSFSVTGPLSPGVAGNVSATAAADNLALTNGFADAATLAQLQAKVPGFSPPTVFTGAASIHDAIYREWNVQVQHSLTPTMAVSVNYVGNFGYNEAFTVPGLNAFCPVSACPAGYADLPAAPIDPRFATVTELQTTGESNYNGFTVSFMRKVSHGLVVTANYTYGHALDNVSNGGIFAFNNETNASILSPQDPSHPHADYGNADYDLRQAFNFNYVWPIPFASSAHPVLKQILGGWTVAGTLYAHSGFPLTVIDGATEALLGGFNDSGGPVYANFLGGPQPSCGVGKPCLMASQFSSATTDFGSQERNQFRGPKFFDTDLNLMKNVGLHFISDRAQLSFGAQFFNLLNHPNFDQPVANIANPDFGSIISTVSVPTSFLGVGLGGDASPRLVQLTAKFSF
jgi:Carboxypeptidase regulatory-like domain/TonB-dependent Receptor Plug Domain